MYLKRASTISHTAKVYVAGHRGAIGRAVIQQLQAQGFTQILTSQDLDLTKQTEVNAYFKRENPEYVFLCAGKVGIDSSADLLYENLLIQTLVLKAAQESGVKRLIFLAGTCMYPVNSPQPMKVQSLLTGELDPSDRPYALSKIAGIEMAWAFNREYGTQFLTAVASNLYGPEDIRQEKRKGVIPTLMFRMTEAKEKLLPEIFLDGTGHASRDFLLREDFASALVFLMSLPDNEFKNLVQSTSQPPIISIGSGFEITIRDLAKMIAEVVGYEGEIEWEEKDFPGPLRRVPDISQMMQLGWRPSKALHEGLRLCYDALKGVSSA